MDLQAQDRCHRIGQTKPVLIFRLVSAQTVEAKILEKAGAKRKLEAVVIGEGKYNLPGSTSQSTKKKPTTMSEMADLLARTEGEHFVLADKESNLISDSQMEVLMDRSLESMQRKGGCFKADDGMTKMEVIETRDGAGDALGELMADSEIAVEAVA